MYSLAVRNGDLSVSVSRTADVVNGADKLLQDLRLWLVEPFGLGPTSTTFGSYLGSFVGSTSTQLDALQIKAEVQRVVGLYQAWQYQRLRAALMNGTAANYSKAQVVDRILGVDVQLLYDSATIRISLRTLAAAPNDTIQMVINLPGSA